MGDTEPIKGKKTRRPVKLTEWRLTSPNWEAIETAAKLYGGDAHEWKDAPGEQQQWEVHTTTSELNVLVPFPQDLEERQLYQLYTAGGRTRACNGREEFISAGPCLCDPDNRQCTLVTHLLVLLPELPGIGVWRLTTSGYNAAVELAGAMRFLRTIHARSHFATAALAIEQRTQKVPGQAERQFVVPVLRLPYSLAEAGLVAPASRPSLPAGVDPEIVSPGPSSPVEMGSQGKPATGEDTTLGEAEGGKPQQSPSSQSTSPDEEREGEELRDTEAGPAAKTPGVEYPSRRPCLHLNGTKSVTRETDGARVEVCIDCGFALEEVRR